MLFGTCSCLKCEINVARIEFHVMGSGFSFAFISISVYEMVLDSGELEVISSKDSLAFSLRKVHREMETRRDRQYNKRGLKASHTRFISYYVQWTHYQAREPGKKLDAQTNLYSYTIYLE